MPLFALHELWSAETSAASDRFTMDERGVPSLLLMERAALSCAHEIRELRASEALHEVESLRELTKGASS